jgi:CARDB
MSPFRQRCVLVLFAILALAGPLLAQEKTPSLTLESVRVEPASPAPDTLCRLSVTIRNSGDRPASALELAVKLNGRELPAYKGRLYLQAVEPGTTREIRLFNFWSTEPGRPAPADGKLTVEVTLARAAWMRKETKDGAEVWTAAGPVEGLPAARSVTLQMAKK